MAEKPPACRFNRHWGEIGGFLENSTARSPIRAFTDWPIRWQILLAFCLLQTVAIILISVSFAWMSANHAERDAIERLSRMADTLSNARFPVRTSILQQMKGLSGADFIAAAGQNRITASTLPLETAQRILTSYPASLSGSSELGHLQPLRAEDQRWLVGGIIPPRSPEIRLLLVLIPEEQWLADRREIILPPLATGSLALLATALMSWWIAARFGSRIQRMDDHVRTLASGQFNVLLPVSGSHELRSLATSINQMAADLSELTERIRTAERTTLVAQVAGGLAHELRNSITGARLAIQLHQRRSPGADRESLDVAVLQLSVMENQIRRLLGLTRETIQPARRGRLSEILDRICRLLKPRCQHGQVDLTMQWITESGGLANGHADTLAADPDGNHAADVSDEEQIESALMNLIQNAIEACGPHGQVRVVVRLTSENVIVDVLDNGPGVREDLRARLFEPFVTSKPEGIGLGLAQARQAAESSGGSLRLGRCDGWTEFRMIIPRLPAQKIGD